MNDEHVFDKNPDMVTREIEDETILVPLLRSSEEINSIYTLNPSASMVWGLIDGQHSVSDIRSAIVEQTTSTVDEVKVELQELLKDFVDINAIATSESH